MQILNSFEPANLSESLLLEFAGKYPDYTNVGVEERCYNIDNKVYAIPNNPIDERLKFLEFDFNSASEAVMKQSTYSGRRKALVKAIGLKAALYYVRKEFDSLTEEDVKQQHEDFERWGQYCKTRINGMKLETGESCVIHFGKL